MDKDITALASRVEEACGELGLSSAIFQSILDKALFPGTALLAEEMQRLRDENAALRGNVQDLLSQREKWLKTQREVIELVDAPSPEKLLHSLRNVLNELTLLRAMSGDAE